MKLQLRLAILAVVALRLTTPGIAQTLLNGSFEDPGGDPPNGYFYILPSGSTFIDGWTVSGQGIDYLRNGHPFWPQGASDGIWLVDLVRGPGEGGTITQVATDLVPGTAYYLCFDLFQGEITANTTVSATFGTETLSFLNSYPTNWTPHEVKFIATDSTAAVTFAAPAAGATDSGVFVDHVRILTDSLMQPTLINGSFELPGGLPPNSYLHLSPGDTSLVGWSIGGSGGFIAYINGMSLPDTDFNPVDGDYQLSFNGGDQAPGTFLSQSFDTFVGQQYVATFFVGRIGNGGGEVSLTATALSADNDVLGSLQAFPPGHGYGTIQSLSFTATSPTTTLRFTDTSLVTVSVDVLLDNVVVTSAHITPCGVDSQPADLLPYQATGYRYQVIGSGVPPPDGWEQSAYDDSAWSVGAAAFGTGLICPLDNTVQTAWPLDTDLLVRRVVFVPAGAANLRVWIGIDNDILEVFFNGTSLGGNIVHEFCAVLDDFSFAVPQALVQAGPNVVAYYLRDRGGVSFFDTRLSACVPLSSSCALICPQDITAPNDPGTCSAIVNFPPPTASGDCSGLTITCTPPSGSTFPVGPSVVTCTATDAAGNSASCSFKVTVNDAEPPVARYAVVKTPALFPNPPRIVGWFQLLATDNCDPDPLIYLKSMAGSFVAGPFHNGDQVEIGHARGLIPGQAPSTFGGNTATIQLNGDVLLWAVDSTGNASTPVRCK